MMIIGWMFAAALVAGLSIRDQKSATTRDVLWALRVTFVICLLAEIASYVWHS